jgi:hypothetical protein
MDVSHNLDIGSGRTLKLKQILIIIMLLAFSFSFLKAIFSDSSTKYSIRYKEESFIRIRIGFDIQQVFSLVGPPLEIEKVRESKIVNGKEALVDFDIYKYSISSIDSDYEVREIFIDENDKVDRIFHFHHND